MDTFLLHGPPGVGKTTALASVWIPRAVDRWGAAGVVICSLTKAAARELASRGLPIPERNVGTLHSLCYHALCDYLGTEKLEVAESHLDEWNAEAPFDGWKITDRGDAEVFDIDGIPTKTEGDRLLAQANCLRHRLTPANEWMDDTFEFFEAYEAWMERHEYVDFTGMIEMCWRNNVPCPTAPRALIVDEAQDSSRLELSLVRRWAEDARADALILAGDSDQCIYGFRGSDPRDFAGLDVPAENHRALTQSYRVPRAVHGRALAWIDRAFWRHRVEYLPTDKDGEVIDAPHLRYTSRHATADYVENLLERDTDRRHKAMILASCGFMLNDTIRELRRRGVPFHNPYKTKNGAWNPLRGGASRLWSFLSPTIGRSRWTYKTIHRWIECVKSDGLLAPGMKTIVQRNAKDQPDEVLSREDVLALFQESERDGFADAILTPQRATAWLKPRLLTSKEKLFEYAFNIAERDPLALDRTPELVVGTIHSVKGGEAAHVVMFPDISTRAAETWMSDAYKDDHDQTVRTIYVGMTRAAESLTICGRSNYKAVDC